NGGTGFLVLSSTGHAASTMFVTGSQTVNNNIVATSAGVGALGLNATAFVGRTTVSGNSSGWFTSTDRKSTRLNSSHQIISYAVLLSLRSFPHDALPICNGGTGFLVLSSTGHAASTMFVTGSQTVNNNIVATSAGVGALGLNATAFVGRTTVSGNSSGWFTS